MLASQALPQLSSCGPIEAEGMIMAPRPIVTFRNCQVAAPLKLHFAHLAISIIPPSATVKLRPH